VEKGGEGAKKSESAEATGGQDVQGDTVWFVDSLGLARRRCHVRWKAHKHRRADTGQDTWIFV